MKKVRSFLAVLLPEDLKRGIYRGLAPIRRLDLDVKWVEEENYHLTLKFFGDLTPEQIQMIKEILPGLGDGEAPFHLRCSNSYLLFPDQKRPRVFCLALTGDLEALYRLQQKTERELVKAGFLAEKKKFHPHITLGRFRSLRNSQALFRLIQENAALPFEEGFPVREIVLMASELTPRGPRYKPLAAFPLRMGRAD